LDAAVPRVAVPSMAEPPREVEEEEEEDGDTWVEVPKDVVSSWRQLSLSGSVSSENLEELVQPHLSNHLARHNRSMSTGNLSALSGAGKGRGTGSLDGGGTGAATSRFAPSFGLRPASPAVGDASPRVASSSGYVAVSQAVRIGRSGATDRNVAQAAACFSSALSPRISQEPQLDGGGAA
jgi:hypothetical protein